MAADCRMDVALEVSPLTVLVRVVLEWACPDELLREPFDQQCRPRQWDRKLTISAITWLMLAVVSGARRSVFAAFQADQAAESPTILATAAALYAKYGRIDPRYTTAVVRESARRMADLLRSAGVRGPGAWRDHRVVVLDGTDLAGTQHRLKPLRGIQAAGLPGRYVVAYDWALGLVIDAVASEDAYTSERELVGSILAGATAGDLFVADRHYCTTAILWAILDRSATLVIRQHEQLRWHELGELRPVGRSATGAVWEQPVEVEEMAHHTARRLRRVVVRLDAPTAEGDTEVALLSNVPGLDAVALSDLYRQRWTIERHFALIKTALHGEVEGLGQPRAALFAMGMAFVAGNALAVVNQALRVSHGEGAAAEVSGYYMADEVAANFRAVDVLIAEARWHGLRAQAAESFWSWCCFVASRARLKGLQKHPRGPKKPQPKRMSGKNRHHYSTYRLLKEQERKC